MLALRAGAGPARGVLFAGYARTAEAAELGRARLAAPSWPRTGPRSGTPRPRVQVTADSDFALARDPAARVARLPHEVFELIRAALPQGPVLVQVPRAGYLVALVCQRLPGAGPVPALRRPDRVRARIGPAARSTASCGWCGRPQVDWECPICGADRVRAPVVGAERTAEELGKAFPQTPDPPVHRR